MARKVFYSFHYDADSWRASQIKNIGVVEGNAPASPNDWEAVKRGGDAAIKRWINSQLDGRTCTIVLVGSKTFERPWIQYEIKKSWEDGKGVLGIRIHNLLDMNKVQTYPGRNPFDNLSFSNGSKLSSVVRLHDPIGFASTDVYRNISQNLDSWIEDAINLRKKYA